MATSETTKAVAEAMPKQLQHFEKRLQESAACVEGARSTTRLGATRRADGD